MTTGNILKPIVFSDFLAQGLDGERAMDTRSGRTGTATSRLAPNPQTAHLLDQLGLGLLIADVDLSIHYRNQWATRWLPPTDDLPSAFAQVRFLDPFASWSSQAKEILVTETGRRFECIRISPAKDLPPLLSVRCLPMRRAGEQKPSGLIVLLEEEPWDEAVSERLEVSQRLASLGKLAARVAHELNNPLDGILRFVNLSLRLANDAPEPKLRSYLNESRSGLMRMVQIIGDLLEFSRRTDGEFDQLTINQIVEQSIQHMASAAEAHNVVVAVDFQTQEMPVVRGSRLYQVCCNLVKNAFDAMPEGGRLSITTGMVGDEVVIRVADTGTGLPPQGDKIFEPFHTTKKAGKGTGLGLAICRDFIGEMGGSISAANGETGGAVFTVRIPIERCQTKSPLTNVK